MPAGAYSIRTITAAPYVLLFENETTKMQAMVFVRAGVVTTAKPGKPLTFTSAGERAELVKIVTGGGSYELSIYPARTSLKGAALAISSAGK